MRSIFARLMLQKKYILLILRVNIRVFFVQSAERSPDGKRKQRSKKSVSYTHLDVYKRQVRDRFEKNVSRKIVVYGMLIPIYRKINVTLLANTLFKIPRLATILNSGSTIMVIGIPIADTKLV